MGFLLYIIFLPAVHCIVINNLMPVSCIFIYFLCLIFYRVNKYVKSKLGPDIFQNFLIGNSRAFKFLNLASHGPKVIKLFSCSTQLSMKFSPLIHVKMPTIVGILTCMSGKNSILGLSEPKKC